MGTYQKNMRYKGRVSSYLDPLVFKFFIGEKKIRRLKSDSALINEIVRKHYDSMPPFDLRNFISTFEKDETKNKTIFL